MSAVIWKVQFEYNFQFSFDFICYDKIWKLKKNSIRMELHRTVFHLTLLTHALWCQQVNSKILQTHRKAKENRWKLDGIFGQKTYPQMPVEAFSKIRFFKVKISRQLKRLWIEWWPPLAFHWKKTFRNWFFSAENKNFFNKNTLYI